MSTTILNKMECKLTTSNNVQIQELSSTDGNDIFCSLCNESGTDKTIKDISEIDDLKCVRDHIEERSNKVATFKYACGLCLFKLHLAIDQNKLDIPFKGKNNKAIASIILEAMDGMELPVDMPSILLPSNESTGNTTENENLNESGKSTEYDLECENEDDQTEEIQMQKQNEEVHAENTNSDASSSPLDVMYEQSESALVTESGGILEQNKKQSLRCRYCGKIFVRVKYYNKHVRSHEIKTQSVRSASKPRSRGRSSPVYIIHACSMCSATFDSAAKLKTHSRIHTKRYYCLVCHKENTSKMEHEFHEAMCLEAEHSKTETSERFTRSNARRLLANQVERPKSSRSRITHASISTFRSHYDYDPENGDEDDDDDDNETTSTCTDYRSRVEHWVSGICLKNAAFSKEKVNGVSPISQKEQDIVLLERLITQSEENVYACIDCEYATNTLRDISLHGILIHKHRADYQCRKCRGLFTQKIFLDYHLYSQNYGDYQCHKCNQTFIYEYKLHCHLAKHQRMTEFPCHFCNLFFLSIQELTLHCVETGHNPRKRKRLICIDKTMTIENKVEKEKSPRKEKGYRCEYRILNIPRTKAPLRIVWPNGQKMFLGDLDFEYEPGRNCARTV